MKKLGNEILYQRSILATSNNDYVKDRRMRFIPDSLTPYVEPPLILENINKYKRTLMCHKVYQKDGLNCFMPKILEVGVIGDFNPKYESHAATDAAFSHSARQLNVEVRVKWLSTEKIDTSELDRFDAFLCAPGSPYKSFEGALKGIRFARENDVPFIGTCGGFQHMVIEYARDVMGVMDAGHAEVDPTSRNLFVTPLTCSLVGKKEKVKIVPGSCAYSVYRGNNAVERFYCNYGLNPLRRDDIIAAGLSVSGLDSYDEARVIELPYARFYFGTLFVPQATSTPVRPHPMISGLLKAAFTTNDKHK